MTASDESLAHLRDRDLLRAELVVQLKDALDAFVELFDMLDNYPEHVPLEQYRAVWQRAREMRETLR